MKRQQETISYAAVGEAASPDPYPTLLSGEESEIPRAAAAVVRFLTVWDVDPSRCWLESDPIFVLFFLFSLLMMVVFSPFYY